MFAFLKQSTASQTRLVGPFVDDTDFKTLETGLTIANTDVKLSKNGSAGANKNAGGGTHRNNGMYSLTFDATDTNTVGELSGSIKVAGALVVVFKFWVLEEDVYDALFGASAAGFDANGRVDVGSWLGIAVTLSATTAKPQVDVDSIDDDAAAADNLEKDYDGTGYAKANSTIGTCTTNTDMRGTDNAALASVLGALADAAAAGDPTVSDTVVAYLKQIVNTLEGAAGIPTFPAEAAPANNVSIAEILRAIHADVTGLNGDAMRGTDGANTTTPPTAVAIRQEIDSNSTQLAAVLNRIGDFAGTGLNTIKGFFQALFRKDGGVSGANIPSEINEAENTITGNYDPTTDSVEAIRDTEPLGTAMLTAAAVNAELVDVLTVDTHALPGQEAPTATPTLKGILTYLYKAWRNRTTSTATEYKLFADDALTVDQKATQSDDGTTFDSGEVGTGP